MPSTSEKQRKFFGAELGRKRAGEATATGMDEKVMEEFAKKPVEHASKKEEKRGMFGDAHSGHGRHKHGRGGGSY